VAALFSGRRLSWARPYRPTVSFRLDDRAALLALNAYGLKAAGIAAADDYYRGEDFDNIENTYTVAAGGCMLVGEQGGKIVAMGGIRRVDESTCELLRMRVGGSARRDRLQHHQMAARGRAADIYSARVSARPSWDRTDRRRISGVPSGAGQPSFGERQEVKDVTSEVAGRSSLDVFAGERAGFG
jgi:hypothetical protein